MSFPFDGIPFQGRLGLANQDDRDGALLSSPHVLAMSATPIPRTLALAVHGDLALSQINSLPPGRTPVATRVFESSDEGREEAYQVSTRSLCPGGLHQDNGKAHLNRRSW